MKEHLRILHVFGKLNKGGAETMIMNLYRKMDRSQVQFDFVVHTNEKCDYEDEVLSLGGKIFRVPKYNGKNHLQYKKAWHRIFQSNNQYKIIHGHVRSTASIYLKIAKKYGLITIAHSHNTSSGKGIKALIKNIFQLKINDYADYLFACSVNAGEWLFGKKAINQSNFHILKNAIDLDKFYYDERLRKKKREELGINNKFVIGHIGRFSHQKNHCFLLDIFYEIYKKNNDAILLLIGDGELRKSIEKKVHELNLVNQVILTGVQSDINAFLNAMDVMVFPSIYEGLPVTLIEAQATGLMCVISDKITKEVKLSPYVEFNSLKNNANDWAENVIKIMNNKFSRYNGKDYLIDNGYDINLTSKKLLSFYLKIINQR